MCAPLVSFAASELSEHPGPFRILNFCRCKRYTGRSNERMVTEAFYFISLVEIQGMSFL